MTLTHRFEAARETVRVHAAKTVDNAADETISVEIGGQQITGIPVIGQPPKAGSTVVLLEQGQSLFAVVPGGASEGAFDGRWRWDTSASGPAQTGEAAGTDTLLRISETSKAGDDWGRLLRTLTVGDVISMQESDDEDSWQRLKITGPPVDNGGWWSIPVTKIDGGPNWPPAKQQTVVFRFTQGGSGGGGAAVDEVWIGSGPPSGGGLELWVDVDDDTGGGGGGGGGDLTYVHIQEIPQTTWNVVHSLGKRPTVACQDAAGTVIFGEVHYSSDSVLIVTFEVALTGRVDCN